MNLPSEEEINAFINALQLCLDDEIVVFKKPTRPDDWLILELASAETGNRKWEIFLKLLGRHGHWEHPNLMITDPNVIMKLTPFLMLTRLDETNMRALAKRDPQYRPFVAVLNLTPGVPIGEKTVHDVEEASRFFFDVIADKALTLRHLAEQSGLTQVTISNFKAGQDVRLSNFFKLSEVAGLDIVIKLKKKEPS